MIPARNNAGNTKNIGNEGRTNQKVLSECAAIRSVSFVSTHNHIIAITDIIGSDAISAPKAGLRFVTSDISATIAPDIAAFMIANNIMLDLYPRKKV